MNYNALVLLPPTNNVSLKDAEKLLQNSFIDKNINVTRGIDSLLISGETWKCGVELNENSYVIEESKELAEKYAKNSSKKDEIASCNRRFEINFDDDEDAKGFNNYINILQQFESFKGAKVWDSAVQEFE